MSAGIPTIAGYIWASAADGFRKWRFNGMRVEDGGLPVTPTSRGSAANALVSARNREIHRHRIAGERCISGRRLMPEGTKLSCRAPCCGRVDDRKCRV